MWRVKRISLAPPLVDFAQAVTISVAAIFVVSTLRPDWLAMARLRPTLPWWPCARRSARQACCRECRFYAPVAKRASPAVVHQQSRRALRATFMDDPVFRHFFGDRLGNQAERCGGGLGSVIVEP